MSQTATITHRRIVDKNGGDFYPTPTWATRALLDVETFTGTIWEPACGDGSMSRVLEETGCWVTSSDLYDRGYGNIGVDFLTHRPLYPDNIVTNPPFEFAEKFVERALMQAKHKVALLLRLQFVSGAGRQRRIYARIPPSRIWVFSERITMYPNGVQTGGSGTTDYAWYIWDASSKPEPLTSAFHWIPAGTRAKYTQEG